jgi:hypothetical protein
VSTFTPDPTGSGATLPLDKVDTYAEFYGVKVSWLGEEPESDYIAFTADHRRALAALNALARSMGDRAAVIGHVRSTWAQAFNHCGCVDHDADDHECDNCEHWGLPPCNDTYSWVVEDCAPDAPNAMPVMHFQMEFS